MKIPIKTICYIGFVVRKFHKTTNSPLLKYLLYINMLFVQKVQKKVPFFDMKISKYLTS